MRSREEIERLFGSQYSAPQATRENVKLVLELLLDIRDELHTLRNELKRNTNATGETP